MRSRYLLPWLLLAVLAEPILAGEAPRRPNILWLVSEDYTASYSGPYGDPLARTPHLDALARQGVTFDQVHSSAPVCAPARSTIITGRYATSMGTQHMRSTRPMPEGAGFFPQWLRQAGYFCTNNAKTDYNTSTSWAAAWDESGKRAHWRHRRPGQPFFAVFNFEQSHESSLHKRQPLVTDPAKVRVPAYLPDTPEVRADIAQYYDSVARADAAAGKVLEELRADGLEEQTIIFYYSDNGGAVSRSKRFLYDNGAHVAMVVRVPAAFRDLAPGAPGSRNGELVNFVDFAPTVLSLAGVERQPQFQGRVLFGPQRAPAPQFTVLFRDRMDERYDLSRAITDGRYRYIRNYYPALPWGQHLTYLWQQASMKQWAAMYREGRLNAEQRAFFEPKPPEELFDCAADPDNVRNLAADPAHRATLERLRTGLRKHLIDTRDTGFLPEPMMVALAAGKSPAVVAGDDSVYPMEQLVPMLDALQLFHHPGPEPFRIALGDRRAVMRYWGAVAAWALTDPSPLAPLLSDADPMVRLAAAEGILRAPRRADAAMETQVAAAWKEIEVALTPRQPPELQLYALNVIARVPRTPPDVFRPTYERLAGKSGQPGFDNYLSRAAEDLLGRAPAASSSP